MKAVWKGSITFGLVNIPINLYAATEPHALGFTLLHAQCHTPLKYYRWCERCKKDVAWDQTVKGIKGSSKGSYLVFTQEQIAQLRPEKTEAITVVEFIENNMLEDIYLDHHYYVSPKKSDDPAYALFVKALAELKKTAIARFVMRDKQYTCALRPFPNYLLLTTLFYSYEIKKPQAVAKDLKAKVSQKELRLAKQLINALSVKKFDMAKFKDTFAQEIKKRLQAKGKKKGKVAIKKKSIPVIKRPSLAESLHASLEQRPSAR